LHLEQAGDRAQQRALARAVGPHDAHQLGAAEHEVDTSQRHAAAEALHQAREPDLRRRGRGRDGRGGRAHGPARTARTVASAAASTRYTSPSAPGWKRSTSSRIRTFARYTWPSRSLRVSIFSGVKFASSAMKLTSPDTRRPGML